VEGIRPQGDPADEVGGLVIRGLVAVAAVRALDGGASTWKASRSNARSATIADHQPVTGSRRSSNTAASYSMALVIQWCRQEPQGSRMRARTVRRA
jgi:hypothetical protein